MGKPLRWAVVVTPRLLSRLQVGFIRKMPAVLEQPEGPAPCSTAAGHRLVNSFMKICFMRWKLAIVCYLRSYTYKVFTFKSHIFSDLV